MVFVYILCALVVLLLIYGLSVYNNCEKLNLQAGSALSALDVCLEKKWDMISNLLDAVKDNANVDLSEIKELQSTAYQSGNAAEKLDASEKLSAASRKLMEIAERSLAPNVKGLTRQLAEAEKELAVTGEKYNDSVTAYNKSIQTFPGNIIALIFGFKAKKMFDTGISA